jgi:hypothetical protein
MFLTLLGLFAVTGVMSEVMIQVGAWNFQSHLCWFILVSLPVTLSAAI